MTVVERHICKSKKEEEQEVEEERQKGEQRSALSYRRPRLSERRFILPGLYSYNSFSLTCGANASCQPSVSGETATYLLQRSERKH